LLPRHAQVLAHVREHEGQRVLCAFNLSGEAATLALPQTLKPMEALTDSGASGAVLDGDVLCFQPWGVAFLRLA
jgi:alpha-glucosidase